MDSLGKDRSSMRSSDRIVFVATVQVNRKVNLTCTILIWNLSKDNGDWH